MLMVFESRVLLRIYEPNSERIRGGKLHNEELYDVYSSSMVKSSRMR
jgi:hypothetical protein